MICILASWWLFAEQVHDLAVGAGYAAHGIFAREAGAELT